MIKSARNLLVNQLYNQIFLKSIFTFSSQSENNKIFYPYLFGGLKRVNINENIVCRQTIRTYFGQQSLDGFKEAYKSLLYLLAEKDSQNLKQIIQPTIYERMRFKNVEVINPDAQIQVICSDLFFAIGGGFDRNKYEFQRLGSTQQMNQYQTAKQYIQRNMYVGNQAGSPNKGLSGLSYNPPTLMAFDILFRTSMKLIPQGGSREDPNPQIHSLQFQLQGKLDLSPLNVIKTYFDIKIGGFFKPLEARKKVLRQIIGQNYEWKIGDVDRLLNKNLNLLE